MASELTRDEVRQLQRELNAFTDERLRGVTPLRVDGDKGPSTDKRIRICKWYLGFRAPTGAGVGKKLVKRLRHPKRDRLFPSAAYTERGAKRRAEQRKRYRQHLRDAANADGVTTFDGVPVAKWMVQYLVFARRHDWPGRLVSGWRDPVYSEGLCLRMCGRTSCPGTCAGRNSNHSGSSRPNGALDVTYWAEFDQLMKRADAPSNPRIFNDLPNDRVHFSANGH